MELDIELFDVFFVKFTEELLFLVVLLSVWKLFFCVLLEVIEKLLVEFVILGLI